MKFTKKILLLLFLMTASSCLLADGAVNLDNVFSTYKVGSYLFVARYGGDFNNTTPVYVGSMTVSENQTLDISGYRDSVYADPLLNGCELTGNSPCIDEGTNITISRSKDISHNNRVSGSYNPMAYISTAVQASCYTYPVMVEEDTVNAGSIVAIHDASVFCEFYNESYKYNLVTYFSDNPTMNFMFAENLCTIFRF